MNSTSTAKNKWIYIFFFAVLLLLCTFLVLSWNLSPVHTTFDPENVYELESTWYCETVSEAVSELPHTFPCDENGTTVIYMTLPESSDKLIDCLCFRISQNYIRIWLDDELILEGNEPVRATWLGKAPGSQWILLRLPYDYAGKELRIELSSPYNRYRGLLNPIYLGTRSSLLYFIVSDYLPELIIACMLLLISITLIVFYFICLWKRVSTKQLLLLGIFGILTSIWLIAESRMLQFFTGHLVSWYNASMIALHMLPMPILELIAELPGFPYKRLCRNIRNFQMFYLVMLILLQGAGIADLMEMLTISIILLTIECIVVPLLVFMDYLHNKNSQIRAIATAILMLAIFAIIELIMQLNDTGRYAGDFLRIGVITFYIIISISSIRNAMNIYVESMHSLYYKELSYTDQMTRCQNRRAFVEREAAWQPASPDVMMMADLNHLKTINDTLGHAVGDLYITACADALQDVFGDKGDCFRLGGDEFLFWGNHLTEEELAQLAQQFTDLAEEKCRKISPLCSVATGIAVYTVNDKNISETMKRADHRMYEKKWIMKQHV